MSSLTDLLADIEGGIRSTGDTKIGNAARYQARAALRDLEKQLGDESQLRIIARIARMPLKQWRELEVGKTIRLLLDQAEAVE